MTIYLLILIFGSSLTSSGVSFYSGAECHEHGKAWVQTAPGPADYACLKVTKELLP